MFSRPDRPGWALFRRELQSTASLCSDKLATSLQNGGGRVECKRIEEKSGAIMKGFFKVGFEVGTPGSKGGGF
jgi:hypothetical protein